MNLVLPTVARRRLVVLRARLVLLLAVAACAGPGATPPPATAAPDVGKRVVARNGVVASAHPLASEAGLEVMRQGGNAIDAAVAAAFAIGVVEPQMSGVGGGGAMLVWRNRERRAEFLDFYPAQPVASFRAARVTGRDSAAPLRVVGVPGGVAGLLLAQSRFGRLTRAQVMAPAIRLAEEGFPMYPVLASMVARDSAPLARDSVARALLFRGGPALAIGERVANPALARVLRAVSDSGRLGFYTGWVARDVVERMNRGGHPVRADHFAAYEPVWRRPLCATYNGRVLLSAPPPEGGMQVLATVQLLDPSRALSYGLPTRDPRAFDLVTSALRVGHSANRGNGDPRWTPVPARGVVSDALAAKRAAEVGLRRAVATVAGVDARPFDAAPSPARCAAFEPYGAAPPVVSATPPDTTSGGAETTHISVVDGDGNAVALTVTNSSTFGSRVAVNGFFLNNSGAIVTPATLDRADAPAWLTRTTTIAPTLVFQDGAVAMVVGSPGGGRIPLAIAQALWNILVFDMDPLDAVRMPRISASATSTRVELESGFDPAVLEGARAMGYVPTSNDFEYARLYIIARHGASWIGVADPRHDGQVRGY